MFNCVKIFAKKYDKINKNLIKEIKTFTKY